MTRLFGTMQRTHLPSSSTTNPPLAGCWRCWRVIPTTTVEELLRALGALFQNSKDRRILRALGRAALNDPEEYVRSSAYKSLQIVNGISRDEHLRLLRDQSLSVDLARVEAIVTALE